MRPPTAFLLLIICTALATSGCSHPDQNHNRIYPSVKLHIDAEKSKADGIPKGTNYGPDGEPYSGSVIYRFTRSDSLFSKYIYREGLLAESIIYNEKGEVRGRTLTGYRNGSMYMKEKYLNGVLRHKEIIPEVADSDTGSIRIWHPNGQLKYESRYTGLSDFQGLMTLYNEVGVIIRQEKYRDGVSVDTLVQ